MGILAAALTAGLVTWGIDVLRNHLRRARLEIGGCEFVDQGPDTRFYFLTVSNRGLTTARACVGQLTIHLKDRDQVYDVGLVDQESLRGHSTAGLTNFETPWQRLPASVEINIHPKQSQRLAIARAKRNGEWGFLIPTETGYEVPRILFGGGGFEYIARVGSDNAAPVVAFGQVLNTGEHPPTMELSEGPTEAFRWTPPRLPLAKRVWRTLRRPVQLLGPPPW